MKLGSRQEVEIGTLLLAFHGLPRGARHFRPYTDVPCGQLTNDDKR